jgi:TatD DNase family protein
VAWFDSHCHLHLCADNDPVDEIVARAREAGVTDMLVVGIDRVSSETAINIARRHDLLAAVGVHPNSADEFENCASDIHRLSSADQVAAIGETGLDFYRDSTPESIQRRAFRAHIEMATACDKALVIHTRESVTAALDDLEVVGPPDRFVFHCWSGDSDQLARAVSLGGFISFAGNVSFKNAARLRALAAAVPGERLLIETDSPFLSPEPHRGHPNEPARLVHVGKAVADARGQSVDAIADLTHANARRFLRLNS